MLRSSRFWASYSMTAAKLRPAASWTMEAWRGQVTAKSSATGPLPGQLGRNTSAGRRRGSEGSKPDSSRSAGIPADRHRKKHSSLRLLCLVVMLPPPRQRGPWSQRRVRTWSHLLHQDSLPRRSAPIRSKAATENSALVRRRPKVRVAGALSQAPACGADAARRRALSGDAH